MITCLYTEINNIWNQQELAGKLALLPEKLRQQSIQKKQWLDMQLSIAGKLLLMELLKKQGDSLSLNDLKYTAFDRLYFDGDMDFNIAHSGNMVICAYTSNGKIGIDIEQVKQINFDYYTGYFTTNEWQYINQTVDKYAQFYHYWTRKEAVLKAIGTGFDTLLSAIDVSEDSLYYNEDTYHLKQLDIDSRYKCHIAILEQDKDIEVIKVEL